MADAVHDAARLKELQFECPCISCINRADCMEDYLNSIRDTDYWWKWEGCKDRIEWEKKI